MQTEEKIRLNKKISKILNKYVGVENSIDTRDKIGYEIKEFLEIEGICFETLNLYTPEERLKKLDNIYFPTCGLIPSP